jgi:UDP:flavonoid glycosyltransferase YjiC (YdhE family)
MVPIHELTAKRIRTEMREVLTNAQYKANAKLLQKQVSAINGIKWAADIIENAITHRTSPGSLPFHRAVGSPAARQ